MTPSFRVLLAPLAVGFRAGVAVRHFAYHHGWLKTRRLQRPVVSVGNLTVGGTGKTPLVALVARALAKQGWKPAILTRGYGRSRSGGQSGGRSRGRSGEVIALDPGVVAASGAAPVPCSLFPVPCSLDPGVVAAGGAAPVPCSLDRADPRAVGDEPALLARALPDVPIVVSADRYRAGRLAESRFGATVHLLDDGFQHLALARDVDIVALDATVKLSDWALLPAGRQREPCSALARADMVVLTRTELADPLPLENRVRAINPRAPIFHARSKLCGLVDVSTGERHPPTAFEGKPDQAFWAFCALGNPRAFFADLRAWGFLVQGETAFRDHHVYGSAELFELESRAGKAGAAALLTTEKDAMNLLPGAMFRLKVFACVIETELREAQAFEEALAARLAGHTVAIARSPDDSMEEI